MKEDISLEEYLDQVRDEKSFLIFVNALKKDFETDINNCQNENISDFLESSVAWAVDSNFGENVKSSMNLWKKFAVFLYSGKIYE
jgi:hypothetical protein